MKARLRSITWKLMVVARSASWVKRPVLFLLSRNRNVFDWLNVRYVAYQRTFADRSSNTHAGQRALGKAATGAHSGYVDRVPRPTIKVHQFHSGSGFGDGVTNSMLLLQRLLRAEGFESEIYANFLDSKLDGRILPFAQISREDDYVLLLHHSMGFDNYDEVVALPCRKILVYHNITPVEFLGDHVHVIPYSKLGRAQLRDLVTRVDSAIGDSPYNAIELHSLGFSPVEVLPLLIDPQPWQQRRAKSKRPSGMDALRPFTVLFVGRVVRQKGQRDLVDAFAVFKARLGRACRLVLVGAHSEEYVAEIERAVETQGLSNDVVVTGHVSDDELHEWYAQSDLYVSLSRHEGFGIPLIEALAYELPVLAWPAGNVPYTLQDAAVLLSSRSPEAVADAMQRIATDPSLQERLAQARKRVLAEYDPRRAMRCLSALLARSGALAPTDPGIDVLAAQAKVHVMGHANGSYSLARVTRDLAAAIEARRPGSVRLTAVEGHEIGKLKDIPDDARSWVNELSAREPFTTGPQIGVTSHYPPIAGPPDADVTLPLFYWEESIVPDHLVQALEANADAVIAPSSFVRRALIDSGFRKPVWTVLQAPNLAPFAAIDRERQWPFGEGEFTFLHVSSCFPRKGVDVLIKAFIAGFRPTDTVRLVIKGFPNPHNDIAEQLAEAARLHSEMPRIDFINEDLSDEAMMALYRRADAIVLPTRGEGFNMSLAEACAAGIPAIVTGFSGHTDFVSADDVSLVDFDFGMSRSHVSSPGSTWVEPKVEDLASAMRDLVQAAKSEDGRRKVVDRSNRARAQILAGLTSEAWVDGIIRAGVGTLVSPPTRRPRVAWVSTWRTQCGIAEYSHWLLRHMTQGELDIVVLGDKRTPPHSPREAPAVGHSTIAWWHAEDGWRRLVEQICQCDPDIIFIQHQWGLFTPAHLSSWLADPALAGRKVLMTMHNTAEMDKFGKDKLADMQSSLARVSRILVHNLSDMNRLKRLGHADKVTLFPHGADASALERVRQLRPASRDLVIGTYGFFLPHKGLRQLVEALAELRRTLPKATLRLVNARYPAVISDEEIVAVRSRAAELGLLNAVQFHTDFLPNEKSLKLLSECDILVFPYQDTNESASGAVRIGLASRVPVLTTPLPIFDELGEAVSRLEGTGPTDIADGIAKFWNDRDRRVATAEAQDAWLAAHDWRKLARRLQSMIVANAVNK
ncbi:Glycosyltransferase involved in cell wall bisynthesis [Rhizobiales bacterium GAS191]|nr:Glycosyltransferase involved in cell wall bisynthesis [Rhizobiales bacterium GAS113]SEC63166.1 Glycosyltransferase involved in cell wall bisynthesis [Rhizobiales bacterium GAS188]SEC65852.1 Glycosyltransferase involved in cell wall bisynthesis [Rhizobiales bacterium GAS191]